MANNLGGFGSESFGDPMGVGGPVQVVSARAVASQTVRVAVTVEPVHVSPAGRADAFNQANYTFSVDAGDATSPLSVGVSQTLVVGPAMGVPSSAACGIDVFTDRVLVSGITYRVTLANIQARFGGNLGSPYSAAFQGAARIVIVKQAPRKVALVDVMNSPFDGTFGVNDSGDLGIQSGIDGLRKRILRRAATAKNAFAHLPGYGTGLRLKKNFSPAQMAEFKADLQGQVRQEPEVADATVSLTQLVAGAVQVAIRIRTKTGALLDVSATSTPNGIVVP